MSIVPTEDAADEPGSRKEPVSRGELSGVTLTGKSLVLSHPPNRPARYSRRQLKTRLALTPCVRATSATDAPSAKVSSTIRRFSSNPRYRRLAATGSVYVSIIAPSGHYRLCPHREHDF